MNNRFPCLIFCFCFGLLFSNNVHAQTNVNAAIGTNTVWAKSGNPYLLGPNASVSVGATLTIQAGVVIKFTNQNDEFLVNGAIVAQGTDTEPIVFTSIKDDEYGGDSNGDGAATQPKDQDWRSVVINSSSGASSLFLKCLFRFGGYYFSGDAAIRAQGSGPTISQCTFFKNHRAIMIGGNGTPTINDCTFDGITETALSTSLAGNATLAGNTFINNGVNGMGIVTGTYTNAANYVLKKIDPLEFPFQSYVIDDDITLNNNVNLTIEPGVVIKFKNQNINYDFKGILKAEGSGVEPIIFTSIRDDQFGGDTNNDGSTTQPSVQDWRNIITQNNQSSFKYCHFRYGGYYFSGAGALWITASNPTVDNCVFFKNSKSLYAVNGAAPTVKNCVFQDNTLTPVSISLSAQPVFENNNYINNKINGLGIVATTYTGPANYVLKKIQPGQFPYNAYVIDNALILESTVNLTIEAGVIIKFAGQYDNYDFRGIINAVGTSTEPVIFTSIRDDQFGGDTNNDGATTQPSSEDWRRILVQNSQSSFNYCNFRYGGYYFGDEAALWLNGSNALVQNCTFFRTDKAIGLANGAAPTIRNCLFQETKNVPVSIALSSKPVLENNTFLNNGINAVGIIAGTYSAANNYTLGKIVDNISQVGTPYYLEENLIIDVNATLTIEPGVILKIKGANNGSGVYIEVKGKLLVQGNAAEPVIFTSSRDDAYGGDANNDGNASAAGHGDWYSVILNNSMGSSFDYTVFRYGGYLNTSVDQYGAIRCLGASNPFVQNCTFVYNSKGMVVGNGAQPNISNCLFTNSGWVPVSVFLGAAPVFSGISFSNNRFNAVGIEGGNYTTAGNYTLEKLSVAGIDNIPYYIHQNITLGAAVHLTVQPGVILKFFKPDTGYDNISMKIEGTLTAQGSPAEPIIFTAERDDVYGGDTNNDGISSTPAIGDWYGFIISNETISSVFSNCIFRYGGYYSFSSNTFYGAVRAIGKSKPIVTDCAFLYNSEGVVAADFSEPQVLNNSFTDCGWTAVSMALTANPTFSNNTIDNKTIRAIGLEEGTYSNTGDFLLRKKEFAGIDNVPYFIKNWLTLESGFNWIIEPGITIKFYEWDNDYYNNKVVVRGSLRAEGTLGEPIVFTAADDDEFGGDIRNNGSSQLAEMGDWLGILLYNSTNSRFKYCKFRYGGYSSQTPQYGVLRAENSSPVVTHCAFLSNTRAVVVTGSSNVALDSCDFNKNRIGLRKEGGTVSIHNSNIFDNIDFGVQNATTVDVDATLNWWGDPTGPLHSVKNPGGKGNKVSDYVLFEPWQQQKVTFKNDIGIIALLQPQTGCNFGSQEVIKVSVANYGSQSQSGFDIAVFVDGTKVIQENVGAFSVPNLSTAEYTLQNKIDLSAYKKYTVRALTQLSGDQNIFNDGKEAEVTNYPSINPNAQFANLLPLDNDPAVESPALFSWSPIVNAQSYDLYLWPAVSVEPPTPTVANIQTFSYLYNQQLIYGADYKWKIVARNPCSAVSSPVQHFTVKSLPDLVVQQITVPLAPFSGQPVEITWKTINQGTNNTGDIQWYDALYLSSDTILDPNTDIYLGAVYNDIALNPGEGFTQMGIVTLPNGIENEYYVFVVADRFNYIQEFNDNNNTSFTPIDINLTPPPDLQVTSVIAPFNAFSEQFISLSFTVTNAGQGPTVEGIWKDRIYLYNQEDLAPNMAIHLGTFPHSGNLNPNQGYTRTENIALPKGVFGKYFIHVRTDLDNTVFEYAFENNNVGRSDTIDITLTPPPDLQVSDIIIPNSASNREPVTLRWTVVNNGASKAKGNWTDQIFMSASPVLDAQAIKVGAESQFGRDIAPGSSYSDERQIIIPANINGPWYFFITTDFANTIYEFNNENNNTRRSDQTIAILSPDLAVENLTVPASAFSGQNLGIAWNVKNTGDGQLISIKRKDKIYLSSNAVFNPQQTITIDSIEYSGLLQAGQSVNKQKTGTLPNGLAGVYYLHVYTDAMDQVFENGSETNNISAVPLNISLSPWPDLQVSAIQGVSPDITAGDIVQLSYTVQNKGVGNIVNRIWKDRLFVSGSPVWNPAQAFPLETFDIAQSLPAGASYTRSTSFSLPMLPGGASSATCYFYIYADADNTLYEHTDENNNTLRSIPMQVTSPPPVDLNLFALQTNIGDTAQSGQQVSLVWCVRNIGSTTELWDYYYWYDAVYLSQDATWDPGDQFVTDWTEPGPLEPQEMYQDKQLFTIPPGLSGNYYFLLVSDHTNLVLDGNKSNNVRSLNGVKPVYLKKRLYSDLGITGFTIPPNATAGQPLALSWTVKNTGAGNTLGGAWTDKVYLSDDPALDNGDPVIGTVNRNSSLPVNDEYTVNTQVIIPNTAQGNYIFWIKADANNSEFEEPSEQNNLVSGVVNVVVPPPSDLQVAFIDHPDSAAVGSDLEVEWFSRNAGTNPANGIRQDIVYLSKDGNWDIDDIALGGKEINGNLPPDGQEKHTLTMTVPGLETGDYHLIVQTDALNNIPELNDTNNIGVSGKKIRINVGLLPIGIVTPGQLNNDRNLYYRIAVPDSLAGETLLVTLNGDSLSGVNELYLAYGKMPTRSDHDYASAEPFKSAQSIVVPKLTAGDYYLLVYGNSLSGAQQSIDLLARILPFEIRSVQANKGGNTGAVTVKVEGGKFEAGMGIKLSGMDATEIPAIKTQFINSTSIFATFYLVNVPIGHYDLIATKQNNTAILKNGFEVVSGNAGTSNGDSNNGSNVFTCKIENIDNTEALQLNFQHVESVRINRIVPITIQFANSGNVDIPVPSRLIISLRGAPVAFDSDDLKDNKQEILIEFREENGPVDILRPGALGSIKFYTKSNEPLRFLIKE